VITSLANSHRESVPEIVAEYLAKFGGKEVLRKSWEEKKAQVLETKGKKRGRPSAPTEVKTAKRRKNGSLAASFTPASAKAAEFEPPSGNWEEEVVEIDACKDSKGNIVVYLTWKGGEKSQHPLDQVYKRCPQKVCISYDTSQSSKLIIYQMLKFYESFLVFKKNDNEVV
jgi:chromobox protein 1